MKRARIFFPTAFILILSLSTSSKGEMENGLITLARVKGRVEVEFEGEKHRAGRGTQIVEGVTVHVSPKAYTVMLMANGGAVLLLENSSLLVENFKVLPFMPPKGDLTELKREPSVSHTALELEKGELVCELKVLDGKSSFTLSSPFGSVSPLPNRYKIKTAFYLRSRRENPTIAAWTGNIELSVPGRAPLPIPGDTHVFFDPVEGPYTAHGLAWSYVRMLENHLLEIHALQKKFEFR